MLGMGVAYFPSPVLFPGMGKVDPPYVQQNLPQTPSPIPFIKSIELLL